MINEWTYPGAWDTVWEFDDVPVMLWQVSGQHLGQGWQLAWMAG